MSREDPLFRLRMPEDMKAALKDVAKENKRSLNAEIVYRLQATMEAGQSIGSVGEQPARYEAGDSLSSKALAAVPAEVRGPLVALIRSIEASYEPTYVGSDYVSPHSTSATKKAGIKKTG